MSKEKKQKDLSELVIGKEDGEVFVEIEGSKFYVWKHADHSVNVSTNKHGYDGALRISNDEVGKIIKVLEWYKSHSAQVSIKNYDFWFD